MIAVAPTPPQLPPATGSAVVDAVREEGEGKGEGEGEGEGEEDTNVGRTARGEGPSSPRSSCAAAGRNDRDEIIDALDGIVEAYKRAKVTVGNDVLLLRYIWLDVDRDRSDTIDKSELSKVLGRVNFQMKRSALDEEYRKFGQLMGLDRSDRKRGLTFEQTVTFLHKVRRDNVRWRSKPSHRIWVDDFGPMRNGKERTRVSAKTFLDRFLRRRQREEGQTLEDVRDLFKSLNEMEITAGAVPPGSERTHIDRDRFEAYLASGRNDAFDPEREREDPTVMTRPLSEYWISSSHNTYLTGDQFTSSSTAEMYMHVLYRGCRCVEIDIWDGVDPADAKTPIPIVKHGSVYVCSLYIRDLCP